MLLNASKYYLTTGSQTCEKTNDLIILKNRLKKKSIHKINTI